LGSDFGHGLAPVLVEFPQGQHPSGVENPRQSSDQRERHTTEKAALQLKTTRRAGQP